MCCCLAVSVENWTPINVRVWHNAEEVQQLSVVVFMLCRWQKNQGVWCTGDRPVRDENVGTGGTPIRVPLCPPQMSHGLTWNRTWVFAVRDRSQAAPEQPSRIQARSYVPESVGTVSSNMSLRRRSERWQHVTAHRPQRVRMACFMDGRTDGRTDIPKSAVAAVT
jgi:hypothetical protein